MNLRECDDLLSSSLKMTSVLAPERTTLWATGISLLEMVTAYQSDGRDFFSRKDLVNTLASYLYAFGWLHFGRSAGLVGGSCLSICPLSERMEELDPSQSERLTEKAVRYSILLETAHASVEPGPEKGTDTFNLAKRVTLITSLYHMGGKRYLTDSHYEDALAYFSYGHGWLDAAVRAGLFRVRDNHEIFPL